MKRLELKTIFFFFWALVLITTSNVFAGPVENLYKELEILDRSTSVTRKSYGETGEKFYKLYSSNPSGKDASEAVLGAARTYRRSYERFKSRDDLDKSLRYYSTLQGAFSTDAAKNAYIEMSDIYRSQKDIASVRFILTKLITKYPDSRQAKNAKTIIAALDKNDEKPNFTIPPPRVAVTPSPKASKVKNGVTVHGVRYFSDKDYTRVVIDLSGNAQFKSFWLNEDRGINKPSRLTIDVDNSVLAEDITKQINIKDGLLSSVRVGYNEDTKRTRIVLDSENIKDYTVFQITTPNRIVADLFSTPRGDAPETAVVNNKPSQNFRPSTKDIPQVTNNERQKPDMTIVNALGLKIKTIVIDPGHGGKDPGAIYNGIKEKDVVLDISLQLRDYLKKDPNLTIYMTRDTDTFIPLEERTAIANKYKADIFISIHANAAKNTQASGIETYVFNVTNDRAALEVAALENSSTEKAASDLADILKDILKYSKLEESLLLAGAVQKNVIKATDGGSKNLGVKQAPFYVLLGARMSSILIETGFISNRDDARKLKDGAYRKKVAHGIYQGLLENISKYNK